MCAWHRHSFDRPKQIASTTKYPIILFHQMLNAPVFILVHRYCFAHNTSGSSIFAEILQILAANCLCPEYCSIISKYWHHIDRASISPPFDIHFATLELTIWCFHFNICKYPILLSF